ncbi:MAG TPA: efflux RND transporter periplasmic adaptor subunit [Pseudomonas sp.]|jgi:macrolide-specific efflux system membrane fusion protein|nr:efflux RND transporter periplasmic adaptor subunit [Pseudomonas sp.]
MSASSILRSRRLWWMALLVSVAAGLTLFWVLRNDAQANANLRTAPVTLGNIEDSITALGTLQPRDYVDVGTQVSGQLLKLHVDLGDQVEQGQLLAEIDPTLFEAKVNATRAQLTSQRAQLKQQQAQNRLAQLQLKRQRALFAERATSEEALQSAEAQVEITSAQMEAQQAQIAQTEASLKEELANLEYTKIYAPMGGTVVSQSAKQGQTLNANQSAPVIVQIADLSRMTVKTQVSEADIGKLKVGMPVYFTTLGRDKRFEASLRQILPTPEVINNVVLYNAEFDVDNPNGELMTQMSAQVFFVNAQARNVLVLPVAAAQGQRSQRGAKERVQVLENGRPVEREVRFGLRDRVHVEVREGLRQGEQVVLPLSIASGAPIAAGGQQRRGPRL